MSFNSLDKQTRTFQNEILNYEFIFTFPELICKSEILNFFVINNIAHLMIKKFIVYNVSKYITRKNMLKQS